MGISISISLTQTSQSVSGNCSYVSATVKYSKTSTTWNGNGAPLTIVVNGSTAWSGDVTFPQGTTSGTLKTVTSIKIPHNNDGTKTVSASATLVSGTNSGTVKASTSKALTRIPRKSTLSVSNGTLNTGQTLTVTRQATSFTHTITAKCGSASTTICTKSTSESMSFTPPLSWASQNTTGTSLTVTYTITTYTGDTSLGSNSYTKTCSIPSSVKPSVSISVSDAMGYSGTYGGWVQGKSKIAVSLTDSGSYGSTIKSRSTTADGSKYTSASFTTGAIKSSGTLTISATVTDSRGRTATDSESITVLSYSSPIISAISATRCNSDGSSNSSGAYIKATFSGKVTALDNNNNAVYSLKYKKSVDTEYTSVTLSDYANVYTVTNGTYVFEAETTSSYEVVITATDNFSSASKTTSGSSIKKIWSIWKNKFSIAFGKVAEEENLFDVNLKSRFRKGIYLMDSANTEYAGIYDNGTNLWIGANQGDNGAHHTGSTYISSGINTNTGVGNQTIGIYVPDGEGDGAFCDVWHKGMTFKILWDGTWKSGTITVPGIQDYGMFRVGMDGQGTVITAYRWGTHLRGIGGYVSAAGNKLAYLFTATLSGNTLTWVDCVDIYINNSSTVDKLTVTSIAGIL